MRTAGGVLLVLALTACGGDTPTELQPTTPPTTVATCTQTVLDSGNGSADAWTMYYDDFSVPDSGRLDITVDWTLPSNAFAVYVVPVNTCTTAEEFDGGKCTFLLRSDPATTPKPRKVSVNLAAGNYRWMIGNYSDAQESLSFQMVLSKGSCPAISQAPRASGHQTPHFERLEPIR